MNEQASEETTGGYGYMLLEKKTKNFFHSTQNHYEGHIYIQQKQEQKRKKSKNNNKRPKNKRQKLKKIFAFARLVNGP